MEVHNINTAYREWSTGLWLRLHKFMRVVHTVYGMVIFSMLFLLFLPLLCIPIVFKSQFRLIGTFNRWWAKLLFIFVGLPFKIEYRFEPDPKAQYIFCPNHFSYLDIPTVGLNKHNTIFVGKSAMERIPLFGFMYRHLHITVDRDRLKSRYTTLIRSMEAIDEGKSLVVYPEGGIMSKNPPQLSDFKDGAFRTAIEKQIPIVPVTIPYNWIILPDNEFLLRWHKVKVIFHEPIITKGMGTKEIGKLKERLRKILSEELKRHNGNED